MKLTALLAAVFLLGACSKNIQTNEAVRESVVEYLNGIAAEKGLDMSAMQVDVAKVSFERDEAQATISIRPKVAPGSKGMEIPYVLDRKGDKWVVRAAATGSGNPHGAAEPSGTPPDGALPAGHPPIENNSGNKP